MRGWGLGTCKVSIRPPRPPSSSGLMENERSPTRAHSRSTHPLAKPPGESVKMLKVGADGDGKFQVLSFQRISNIWWNFLKSLLPSDY